MSTNEPTADHTRPAPPAPNSTVAQTPEQRAHLTPAPTAAPSVPGFEIVAELGRGGMGVVHEATQTRLYRVVCAGCF